MRPDTPTFAAYQAAIGRWGTHPVQLDTDVRQMTMVCSALHLALRHPHFPDTIRTHIEGFLTLVTAGIAQLSPTIAAVLEAGNDPANDEVP